MHKNKTFTTLLAVSFGGLGLHRFYLKGIGDLWGWTHLAALPLAVALESAFPSLPGFLAWIPVWLSMLAGILAGLVTGVTPDDKWDARHNPDSGRRSQSGWPVAALLVLGVGLGATGLIALIARSFDLLLTGGAYG